MKLSITLLGLAASQALCTPTTVQGNRAALEAECGAIDTKDWNLKDVPKGTDFSKLKKCSVHPNSLGIKSTSYKPVQEAEKLQSSPPPANNNGQSRRDDSGLFERSAICDAGGRGNGPDYDYGCTGGWCWRNCNGPWPDLFAFKKEWCWLKYEGGKRTWVPCGGWKDCEWSYNNKNAKCATGNCKSCGCGC